MTDSTRDEKVSRMVTLCSTINDTIEAQLPDATTYEVIGALAAVLSFALSTDGRGRPVSEVEALANYIDFCEKLAAMVKGYGATVAANPIASGLIVPGPKEMQ